MWKRVAPLLPSCSRTAAVATRGGCAFPTEWPSAAMYVLRTGVAWRDVPAETVGCSGVTAWRRLRGWTEAGVWPRPHTALLTKPRRAGLLDLGSIPAEALHPQRPHQPFRASPSETGSSG
ncbi:transposase [Streptomyces bobili]|uniref:transposase n=1 Tax=Streptomyces bobili TaxID=67280 RepID=UPI0033F39E8C